MGIVAPSTSTMTSSFIGSRLLAVTASDWPPGAL